MQDCFSNITDLSGEKNRVFILEDKSDLKLIEYKILLSQNYDWQVKCYRCRLNGKEELFMLTDKYYRLSELLPTMESLKTFMVVKQICEGIKEIHGNGFLTDDSLLLDLNDIYYDASVGKVKLIYLPVIKTESRLAKNMIGKLFNVIDSIAKCSGKHELNLFFEGIRSREKSIIDVEGLVYELSEDRIKQFLKRINEEKKGIVRQLYLESLSDDVHISFSIDKDIFTIGRNYRIADGFIPNNRLVGRIHCAISKKNGKYVITDFGSLNGTYLNNNRLTKNQEYPLIEGDILRIANVKFLVKYLMEE